MFSIINKRFFSNIEINIEQLFSQLSELGITFVSTSKNMTCEYYLNQPKSMLEWKLIEKLIKNPRLKHEFIWEDGSLPLICEFYEIYLCGFY